MNPKDKKSFEQIKKIARNLEQGEIYTSETLEGIIKGRGINVQNMGSVLQALTKQTPYLQQLTDGNYMRKRD